VTSLIALAEARERLEKPYMNGAQTPRRLPSEIRHRRSPGTDAAVGPVYPISASDDLSNVGSIFNSRSSHSPGASVCRPFSLSIDRRPSGETVGQGVPR
jgi:hypothetical protein